MCGYLLRTPLLGTWPATQACALSGNRTRHSLVRRLALSPLSHTSQGRYDRFNSINKYLLIEQSNREFIPPDFLKMPFRRQMEGCSLLVLSPVMLAVEQKMTGG